MMPNRPQKKSTTEVSTEKKEKYLRVSKLIQEILTENHMALQPYHDPREYELGIIPRVRLVDTTKDESNDGETPDTGEAEGSKEEPEATESQQS